MPRKDFRFEVKSVKDTGEFTGYASVFGNVDRGGDIVERGAFTKTLTEQDSLPLLWSHFSDTPIGVIGGKEDDYGLFVQGTMDMNVQAAREKHSLMKLGAIKGMSIGYETLKEQWEKSVRRLKEVRLWEISLCVFPMNTLASVTGVKSVDEVAPFVDGLLAIPAEAKPYPNEHSVRLRDPDEFTLDSFKRTQSGLIYGTVNVPLTASVIWAKLKSVADESGEWTHPQALRFSAKDWSVDEAKAWLKEQDIKYIAFEPASDKAAGRIEEAIVALQSLLAKMEPEKTTPPEPEPTDKALAALASELKALGERISNSL